MGDVHDQALFAFDADGVRITGVGGAYEFGPVRTDRVFGRVAADLVLVENRLDEARERERGALARFAWFIKRDAAEIADEFLGQFTERMRLVSPGSWAGSAFRLRRAGCSARTRQRPWPTRCRNRGNRRETQI